MCNLIENAHFPKFPVEPGGPHGCGWRAARGRRLPGTDLHDNKLRSETLRSYSDIRNRNGLNKPNFDGILTYSVLDLILITPFYRSR